MTSLLPSGSFESESCTLPVLCYCDSKNTWILSIRLVSKLLCEYSPPILAFANRKVFYSISLIYYQFACLGHLWMCLSAVAMALVKMSALDLSSPAPLGGIWLSFATELSTAAGSSVWTAMPFMKLRIKWVAGLCPIPPSSGFDVNSTWAHEVIRWLLHKHTKLQEKWYRQQRILEKGRSVVPTLKFVSARA